MALPYARSQLVRYLTEKVMENVTKQIAEQTSQTPQAALAAPKPGTAAPSSPDIAKLVESINAAFAQTYEQIEALEARLEQVDRRMGSMEERWGWKSMAKVVFAVALAFVLGLVAYQLLHLAGIGF